MVLTRSSIAMGMGPVVDYLASLADDAEEVDLSSFERIEELDDAT
jgi:hypothetical protein